MDCIINDCWPDEVDEFEYFLKLSNEKKEQDISKVVEDILRQGE